MNDLEKFLSVATPYEWDCWLTQVAECLADTNKDSCKNCYLNNKDCGKILFCHVFDTCLECMGNEMNCSTFPPKEYVDYAIDRLEKAGMWKEDTMNKQLEKQIGGNHYLQMPIQPWKIIDAHGLNFYEGNILKYLLRRKGSRIEDLKKLIHYAEHLLKLEYRNEYRNKYRNKEI